MIYYKLCKERVMIVKFYLLCQKFNFFHFFHAFSLSCYFRSQIFQSNYQILNLAHFIKISPTFQQKQFSHSSHILNQTLLHISNFLLFYSLNGIICYTQMNEELIKINYQKYTMLGLESHLQIEENEISSLSISSNPHKELSTKNISLQNPSTLNSQAALYSNQTSNVKNQKIRQLRLKMQQISKNQQDMDRRMKMFIALAEKQVKKKEEQNQELENLITSLKQEINQSRNDLEILSNYLSKKFNNPQFEQSKTLRNSNFKTKNILNLPESKKEPEDKQPKKVYHHSPKLKLLIMDRTRNQSPYFQDQKIGSFTRSILSSPLHCKPQSPFK